MKLTILSDYNTIYEIVESRKGDEKYNVVVDVPEVIGRKWLKISKEWNNIIDNELDKYYIKEITL